ncbi:unnamed protein product [Porites lobata]|uniref:Tripartite motif-containing protein 2 n=1 Tax=Porites lobata TaxID=104759 RepID=A0ABN8NP77_9CNID|nr:unnamed protein product [Porites lobata]
MTSVEELMRLLQEHEKAVLTSLDVIEGKAQRDHATQREHFQISMNQLQTHVDWCKDILQRKKSVEILQAHALIAQCRGVLNAEKKNIYKPSHVRYEINKELVEDARSAVSSMGQVVVSNTDPLQSLAEGTGLKVGEVGREAKITLTTNDFDGNQCYDENDRIAVTVKTPSSKGLSYVIEPNKNGEYSVSYTPDCVGQHEVLIAVNDEPLNGSPWSVYVTNRYKYSFSIGLHARGQGQFFRPISIAIDDKSGNVAVADENRVQIYSLEGTYLRDVAKNGLITPTSVAFTKSSELIVVSSSNLIFCFDQSYRFVKTIALTNKELNSPRRLTIAGDGRLVVCDWGDHTVKVLSSDGSQLLLTIRESANALPRHAISHQKMIFVSCYLAGVVKVFSEKDGVFLYSIGVSNLSTPAGLEVDRFDNLVVCDCDNARLQIFTLDGKFLNTVKGRHDGLSEPYSIAVSSASQLFVTDYSKHCVHVFQ